MAGFSDINLRSLMIVAVPLAVLGAAIAGRYSSPAATAAECTRLAAHPDEGLSGGGVAMGAMRVDTARNACLDAVAANDRPEFHYRYARTLYAGQPSAAQRALALRHAQIAHDRQWPMAAVLLAEMHARGSGTPPDPERALRLLEPAIARDVPSALMIAGDIEMRQAGNAARQARGVALLERAAIRTPAAYLTLGGHLLEARDYRRALASYEKAEAAGLVAGTLGVGDVYRVQARHAEAARHYRRAADAGSAAAQGMLVEYFYSGTGVPQNRAEALRWAVRASDGGDSYGQYMAGFMYFHGQGTQKDALAAERHLQRAVAQNHAGSRRLYDEQVRPFTQALRRMPSGDPGACMQRRVSPHDRNIVDYFNRCDHPVNTLVCVRFTAGEVLSLFDGRDRETCNTRVVQAGGFIDNIYGADQNSSFLRIAISQSAIWVATCHLPLVPQRDGNRYSCVQ